MRNENPQATDDPVRLATGSLHRNASPLMQSQDLSNATNNKRRREERGDGTQEDGPTPPEHSEAQEGPHTVFSPSL